jgi:hypothetical protein
MERIPQNKGLRGFPRNDWRNRRPGVATILGMMLQKVSPLTRICVSALPPFEIDSRVSIVGATLEISDREKLMKKFDVR